MHSYRRTMMGLPQGEPINIDNYLTFTALQDGFTFSFTNPVEYCVNGIGNWIELPAGTTSRSINTNQTISIRASLTPNSTSGIGTFTLGKQCNVLGDAMSLLYGDNAPSNYTVPEYAFYRLFALCTKLISASGLILKATTLNTGCYYCMFYLCTNLTAAPSLPANTMKDNCYMMMFQGCTNLTAAPSLPATTLATSCYSSMFYSCTNLTTAPSLPATTLADSCYYNMFTNCTSLTTAPSLPATTLATNCYNSMFYSCTNLTTAPSLPATTLASSCYSIMFYGCTSLTTAPSLPATTLATSCYSSMFRGCTSLTTVPSLPATTLASSCYNYMFYDCLKLNYINAAFTTTPSTSYTNNWVNGVAATGTFIKNKDATWDVTGVHGVPTGWIVKQEIDPNNYLSMQNDSSTFTFSFTNPIEYTTNGGITWKSLDPNTSSVTIPARTIISIKGNLLDYVASSTGCGTFTITTSSNNVHVFGTPEALLFGDSTGQVPASGFRNLFKNCTAIKHIDGAFLSNIGGVSSYTYAGMFYGCTNLTSGPALPAASVGQYGYYQMFYGCTNLTNIPIAIGSTALAAPNVGASAYREMFYNCSSFDPASCIPRLPATTLATYCYAYMFRGCTKLTTAPTLPATTLATYCYYQMFYGCTKLTTAPTLPATTLVSNCYGYMFYSCSKLNYINSYFTDTPSTSYTNNWVNGVASTGTYVKNTTAWSVTGVHGVPTGWTIVEPVNSNNYLTFDVTTATSIKFSKALQYSLNGGSWTSLAANTALSVSAGSYVSFKANLTGRVGNGIGSFTITTGAVSVRGNALSLLYGDDAASYTSIPDYSFTSLFAGCAAIKSCGAIFPGVTSVGEEAFLMMFDECTGLATVDSGLLGSITTIGISCYEYMFYGCTSLTSGPTSLPATTLYSSCYYGMFEGCSKLTSIITSLPATRAAENCYLKMFYGCAALTTAPALPATTLYSSCYNSMFEGCSKLSIVPQSLPATALAGNCYANMFKNCTSLVTAPTLPATSLNTNTTNCYSNMFYGCSKLNKIDASFLTAPSTTYMNNWVYGVATSGTFVKNVNATWLAYSYRGVSGVPVGWFVEGETVEPEEPDTPVEIDENNYLTITPASTTSYTITWNDVDSTGYTCTLNVLIEGSTSWTGVSYGGSIAVSGGKKAYLKSTYSSQHQTNGKSIGKIGITGNNVTLSGNCMSILYGDDAATATEVPAYAMKSLFEGCRTITAVESLSKSFLPATTIGTYSYSRMFYGCTNLASWSIKPTSGLITTASQLPATTLGTHCYNSMFYNCSKFTSNMGIAATSYPNYACYQMFYGCSKMTNPATLGGTFVSEVACGTYSFYRMYYNCTGLTSSGLFKCSTLSNYSCYQMFYGCSKITSTPVGFAPTKVASSCCYGMFQNCMLLTTAMEELPATTLYSSCYNSMFYGCSVLTTAPKLPATELTSSCYNNMFNLCTSLNYINAAFTTTPSTSYTNNWVNGVAATGTFIKNPSATWNVTGVHGVPTGWTVLTTEPGGSGGSGNTQGSWSVVCSMTGAQTGTHSEGWRSGVYKLLSYNDFSIPAGYDAFESLNCDADAATPQWNSSGAKMVVTINNYDTFEFYIGSSSEYNWDYIIVGNIDKDEITYLTSYNNSYVYAHTRGLTTAPTGINNMTKVTFSNLGGTTHTFTIIYRKDSSGMSGADVGVVLLPSFT